MRTRPMAVALSIKNQLRSVREGRVKSARVTSAIAALVVGLGSASVSWAQDGVRHVVNIQAQPIGAALKALADQTGLQVLVFSQDAGSKQAPAVQGKMTNDEALAIILRDSGLTFQKIDDRTVAIRSVQPLTGVITDGENQSGFMRVAQGGEGSKPAGAEAASAGQQERATELLDEIVVTAQKREERLQDVPISISVLGGAALDTSTREGVLDALKQVPGIVIRDGGNLFVPAVRIRGIAEIAGLSPAAYYLDAAPIDGIPPDAGSFDLDRIEVLRGPQGTLYGASAMSGVVRILTNQADTEDFEFKARAGTQTTDGGDIGYRGDAAVNLPVVEGKLGVRAVVGYQDLGGWVDQPNRKDANNNELGTLRLKTRYTPTDKLTIDLAGWWSRQDFGGQNSSTSEQTRTSLLRETAANDFDLYSAEIVYDLGAAQLTSRTSHIDFSTHSFVDFYPLYLVLGFDPNDPEEAPFFDVTLYDTTITAKTFAQELILNSTAEGPWNWTAGAMYRDNKGGALQGFAGLPLLLSDVNNSGRSKSYAVFGEVTRELIEDTLELTGGLRYFHDKVSLQENRTYLSLPELIHQSDKFEKVTPRAVLAWHPNPNATVYASYAQGFRSGALQDPSFIRVSGVNLPNARPDTLTNYEIGTKQSLMDGQLYIDAAIYYIKWKDVIQVLKYRTSNNIWDAVLNGGNAEGLGAEIGLTLRPVRGLVLNGGFSWNDLTFDEAFPPFSPGDRINSSPKYTANGSINYSFPLASVTGHVGVSADYTGKFVDQGPNDNVQLSPYVGGEARFNARVEAGIETDRGWGAKAYIDNLSNNYAGGGKNWRGFDDWFTRPRPRTIGFQFEYRY